MHLQCFTESIPGSCRRQRAMCGAALRGMERRMQNMASERRTERPDRWPDCKAATGSACYSGEGYRPDEVRPARAG